MSLAEAEAAERAAFDEIGRLGEVELAAVKAWIASGCEGDRPRPDEDGRRVLTDQLTMAMAVREAVEGAAGGQDGAPAPVAPLTGEIATTGRLCRAARAA